MKFEPRSTGIDTVRKKKPKELAVITECCTGCAGSPACVEYCPVEDCMFWVPDEDHPPFGRIQVDPILCIGCKKCTSKGPDGFFRQHRLLADTFGKTLDLVLIGNNGRYVFRNPYHIQRAQRLPRLVGSGILNTQLGSGGYLIPLPR